ncbi:hypothetical protein [Thermus hydrothermalis]|uniref:hypothetical protein n=1 Tax=Thermus hydrothermalis TaxID=2908148 RepID=UPI001FAABEC7|nr:hypothetical protein [Thermus hydrothermalis]
MVWPLVEEAITRLVEYRLRDKARLRACVGVNAYDVVEADLTPPREADPEVWFRERLAAQADHPYPAWVEVRGR